MCRSSCWHLKHHRPSIRVGLETQGMDVATGYTGLFHLSYIAVAIITSLSEILTNCVRYRIKLRFFENRRCYRLYRFITFIVHCCCHNHLIVWNFNKLCSLSHKAPLFRGPSPRIHGAGIKRVSLEDVLLQIRTGTATITFIFRTG